MTSAPSITSLAAPIASAIGERRGALGLGRGGGGRRLRLLGLEVDDLLPAARDLVGEDEQQVAALGRLSAAVDRGLLVGDHLRCDLRGSRSAISSASIIFGTSSGPRPREIVVAPEDDVVERLAGDARDRADVLVATIAGRGEHADAAAAALEAQRRDRPSPAPRRGCARSRR